MSLKLNPPPLQIPQAFANDKQIAAFFSSFINVVYQMWNALYGIRADTSTKTTDATPTAIIRVPVDEGKTVMIQASVVARRTGGSAGTLGDSAFYVLTGAFKNVGGVLTGIGTPDLIGGEDNAAWDCGFDSVGQEALVVVTGDTNNNITWNATVSNYEVGA